MDCEDLYFNYAWYAVDAAASGCIFRTILPVWHFTVILVSFLCSYYWFALNYAAYFAEIYRAGIEAVPAGQYEAAEVLGYSKTQTFVRIIFPQMVKRVMPPVTNEVITLVKDTSLAICTGIHRNVYARKTGCGNECKHYAAVCSRCILLHFQLLSCMDYGTD